MHGGLCIATGAHCTHWTLCRGLAAYIHDTCEAFYMPQPLSLTQLGINNLFLAYLASRFTMPTLRELDVGPFSTYLTIGARRPDPPLYVHGGPKLSAPCMPPSQSCLFTPSHALWLPQSSVMAVWRPPTPWLPLVPTKAD